MFLKVNYVWTVSLFYCYSFYVGKRNDRGGGGFDRGRGGRGGGAGGGFRSSGRSGGDHRYEDFDRRGRGFTGKFIIKMKQNIKK